MKLIANLFVLFIFIILVFFDYKNLSVTSNYFLLNDTYHTAILPLLVSVAFFLGVCAGGIYSIVSIINTKKTKLIQNKRVEQFSVDKDNTDLKIKTLEAKVKTLETALEKALKMD